MVKKKPVPRKHKSTNTELVKLDMEFEGLVTQLAAYEEKKCEAVLDAIEAFQSKVEKYTWDQLRKQSTKGRGKTGFNIEPLNQFTTEGEQISSIRVNQKIRARFARKDEYMILISLHPDHDSAYKVKGGEDISGLPLDESEE